MIGFSDVKNIILCGPSLPMRSKARVLALISVMPKLISAVYQQLDYQMHTAEQLVGAHYYDGIMLVC
jgi:hypothetical protein